MICTTSPHPTIPTRIRFVLPVAGRPLLSVDVNTLSLLALYCTRRCPRDHKTLNKKKENQRWDHPQRSGGHQASPIGPVLLHKRLDSDRDRHTGFVPQEHAGNKKFVVRKKKRKDRYGCDSREG